MAWGRAPVPHALRSSFVLLVACSGSAASPSATPIVAGYAGSTHTSTACTTAALAITAGAAAVELGHAALPLLFRNTGTDACLLRGYPIVEALDASGGKVALQQTPMGFAGGLSDLNATPPTIELRPGATASALVEGVSAGDGGSTCSAYVALLVTPSKEARAVKVMTDIPACAPLEVHPVVEGAHGSQ